MSNQKSIKKNMIMNIILTLSNLVFPLITFSYISRVLTPVGTGKVAFVTSILSYFTYIATLGIPTYGLREASKIRDDKEKLSKFVYELFSINIISMVLSYVLLFICVTFITKLNNYKLLFIIMSSNILLNSIGFEWLYSALEEYSYITKRSLIFKLIYIPLVFLLIKSKNDYLWYGFLSIFVTSANYICNLINVKKYIYIKKYKNINLKHHVKPIMVLFSASIIISIYANFDVVMLGFISTEWDVGLYNTALKLKNLILSLSTAITSVLIPRISYCIGNNNNEEVKKLVILSLKTSCLLALPLTVFILIFSRDTIMFFFGNQYIESQSTLIILMLSVIPLILTNLFGNQLLIPLGKEKIFSRSVLVGVFINLILNIVLIPNYGSFGATIGTLITEIWNMFYMGCKVKEYSFYILKKSQILKFGVSMFFALTITLIFSNLINNFNLFLKLLIKGISFFALYYIILLLLKEPLIVSEINKISSKIKGGTFNAFRKN